MEGLIGYRKVTNFTCMGKLKLLRFIRIPSWHTDTVYKSWEVRLSRRVVERRYLDMYRSHYIVQSLPGLQVCAH